MTFLQGTITGVKLMSLEFYKDHRGSLVETFRSDQLKLYPAMSYVSYTRPGKRRGPHEHRRQTDVFSFIGPGQFKIVLWDHRKKSKTYKTRMVIKAGENSPLTLVVPPGVIHGYKNISKKSAMVINYPNQLYKGKNKKSAVDEIRHEDSQDIFYQDFMRL